VRQPRRAFGNLATFAFSSPNVFFRVNQRDWLLARRLTERSPSFVAGGLSCSQRRRVCEAAVGCVRGGRAAVGCGACAAQSDGAGAQFASFQSRWRVQPAGSGGGAGAGRKNTMAPYRTRRPARGSGGVDVPPRGGGNDGSDGRRCFVDQGSIVSSGTAICFPISTMPATGTPPRPAPLPCRPGAAAVRQPLASQPSYSTVGAPCVKSHHAYPRLPRLAAAWRHARVGLGRLENDLPVCCLSARASDSDAAPCVVYTPVEGAWQLGDGADGVDAAALSPKQLRRWSGCR